MLFISEGFKLRLRCTILHIWFLHHALKHKQENFKLVGVQQHYAEVHLWTYTFSSQSSQFDTSTAKQSHPPQFVFLLTSEKKERKKSQNTLIQQYWFLFCVISHDKFVGISTTFNLHDSLHSIIHLQVLVLSPTFRDSPVLVLFPTFHDSPVLVLFPTFHDLNSNLSLSLVPSLPSMIQRATCPYH